MKRSWDLKPNLLDCLLEERIVPAFNNFGIIILTTSGLSLVTPFPGASNNASGSGGSSNTAASVSGAAQPTSLYLTGRGVSSLAPGNFTGNPSVGGGGAGPSGGASFTIQVGSGSDQAGGPVSSTQASSRNNPADNGNRAPVLAYIGSVGVTAASSSAPSAGQSMQTAPVPQLPPQGVVIPGTPTPPSPLSPSPANPMNPQLGAPRLVRGLGTSLMPSLPGGLGVGNSMSPPGTAGP